MTINTYLHTNNTNRSGDSIRTSANSSVPPSAAIVMCKMVVAIRPALLLHTGNDDYGDHQWSGPIASDRGRVRSVVQMGKAN
jgi:hypothetical protein